MTFKKGVDYMNGLSASVDMYDTQNTDEEKELAKRYLEKADALDLIAMLDL